MPTVLLVRHGRTAANATGVLAGWTPGVALDDHGGEQAAALAVRLGVLPVTAIVSSPLQRCQETAQALAAAPGPRGVARPDVQTDERLGECRYGDWTGRELKALAKEPLWQVVQQHPSAAVFPGPDGESLADMQHRAVRAIREWDAEMAAAHGAQSVWVAVTHGDVIKAVLADALGAHLDAFQRIQVAPCSVSVVNYTHTRPFVVRTNDVGGDLSALAQPRRGGARGRRSATSRRPPSSDATVGGGA